MQLPAKLERPILIFIALLLLLFSYLLYSRTHQLINSYQWVNHTNVVQLRLEEAFSNLKDAETAQRGFLLTNDSSFLVRFRELHFKTDSLMFALKELTKDNEQQQKNITTLQRLINSRFRQINNVLFEHALDNKDDLHKGLLKGKRIMDSIRQYINTMKGIEIELLHERESLKNKYVLLTPFNILLLAVLSFIILAFSYNRISYQLRISRSYSHQLQEKNEELAQKNFLLKKSNEELHSFNYIASHDLREPLRKIKTFISILLQNKELSKEASKYAGRIDDISDHMQKLLDDLSAYSRMSMGERKMEEVNLNQLLQKVQKNMQESINENKAVIQYEVLPTIKGIRFQLEQLFENLISNALKYRQPDKPPVITLESAEVSNPVEKLPFLKGQAHYIKITFADNGIGFPQKYADKVFELFQRLHHKKEYSGTGIGLTICKKVVENHGGYITVESEENKGSTFYIYLPT